MKQLFALLLAMILTAPALAANGNHEPLLVDTFALEDLKPGMLGVGKTVIRGTDIEDFTVEILELIPDGGFDGGAMILARFSGPVVDFSNGIAGGYSGSPVYINGKLLGAVSMAMPFTDTHIGGITPIHSMVAALPDMDEVDFSQNTVIPTSDNNGTPIDEDGFPIDEQGYRVDDDGDRIAFVSDWNAARAYNDRMQALGSNKLAAIPASTPFYFSGISPNVLNTFGDKLTEVLGPNFTLMERPMGKAADYGLFYGDSALTQKGGAGLFLNDEASAMPLKPGDACAVSFLTGDIEFYSIGTVTYSDELGRMLIFGHPMMAAGETNLPIGKGYITWTFESIQRAFKEGVRLNSVGTVTRDQGAACGGSFNIEPDMIPVTLKIKDVDLDQTTKLNFEVIRDPDMTPMILSMAMVQGATQVLDRKLSGTVKLSYHIEGIGLKEPLRRTNYYFDDFDVVSQAAFELMPMATLLETNIYRDVDITDIKLMLEITRNRTNASIDDAEIMVEPFDDQLAPELEPDEADPQIEGIEHFNEYVKNMTEGEGEESSVDPRYYTGPLPGARLQQDEYDGELGEYVEDIVPFNGANPEVPTYSPGETIRVKVRLQPYRTDAVWREFSITVPEDFPSGSTMLVVHGGGDLISSSELGGKGRNLWGMGPIIDIDERDLDSIIDQIMTWPLNHELLITLERPYDPTAATEFGDENEEVENFVDAKYQMEWVIYNGFYLPVEILTEEDRLAREEMAQQAAEQQQEAIEESVEPEGSSEDDDDDDDCC